MVEDYDSRTFQYVYSIEQQDGKSVSREYRSPIKGSHVFRGAVQEVGGAAIALMFLPDLQSDYEMRCEGSDERNGQMAWGCPFRAAQGPSGPHGKGLSEQRCASGVFKGRAWISKDTFQVVHLEAGLTDGVPDIGLEGMTFSVDYGLVQSSAGKAGFWLPNAINAYWDFNAHRTILVHKLSEFELFAVAGDCAGSPMRLCKLLSYDVGMEVAASFEFGTGLINGFAKGVASSRAVRVHKDVGFSP